MGDEKDVARWCSRYNFFIRQLGNGLLSGFQHCEYHAIEDEFAHADISSVFDRITRILLAKCTTSEEATLLVKQIDSWNVINLLVERCAQIADESANRKEDNK